MSTEKHINYTINEFKVTLSNEIVNVWETTYINGNQEIQLIDQNGIHEIYTYPKEGYSIIDGVRVDYSPILNLDELSYTDIITRLSANWVRIKTESFQETWQNEFEVIGRYVIAGVASGWAQISITAALLLADCAIADDPTSSWLTCTKVTYGNTYALNHYKYESTFTPQHGYVYTTVAYNPPIY